MKVNKVTYKGDLYDKATIVIPSSRNCSLINRFFFVTLVKQYLLPFDFFHIV